jgi:hypothetical protein
MQSLPTSQQQQLQQLQQPLRSNSSSTIGSSYNSSSNSSHQQGHNETRPWPTKGSRPTRLPGQNRIQLPRDRFGPQDRLTDRPPSNRIQMLEADRSLPPPRQADRSRSVGGRLHVRPVSGEIPTTPTHRRLRSGSDSESLSVEHIPESPAELEASATRIASAFSPLETSPKL